MGLAVKLKAAQKGFLNSQKVLRNLDKGVARAFNWYGTVTRRAIRRAYGSPSKRKPRPAPKPPRARQENGLRKVLYYYDRRKASVVVGVVRDGKRKVQGKTVAALHEQGGKANLRLRRIGGGRNKKGRYTRTIFVKDKRAKAKTYRFKARPAIAKAGDKNRRKALEKLRNAIARA